MTGRPSTYSEELAATICELLASGQSLVQICQREDMPAQSTVFLWLHKHEAFSDMYVRAREAQMDYLAEDLLEIADDGTNDWMERRNSEGEVVGWVVNGEAVQRSRLRVDTRKWLMSKLAVRKYGDRVRTEIGGTDGAAIKVETSEVDLARKVAFLLSAGEAKLKASGE